jgi:uncharacterized membrane protein
MSDWYYAADNEQKGPINESELKANLAANKIPPDALVWKDGMDNWTPANQVPAFSFRAAPEPAKIQPATSTTPAAKVVAATPGVNNPDSTKPVEFSDIMGTPEALEVDPEDAEQNKMIGVLCYLAFLCFLPLITSKDSPFAKYHANQGFVLFLLEIAISIVLYIVGIFVGMLPGFLGFIMAIFGLLYVVPLGLTILGIINAAAGKCVPLPFIGSIKIKIMK